MDRPILLITYNRLSVTEREAEAIVDDGYRAVDAVEALSGGEIMREEIIYHFNGMGASAMIPRPDREEYLKERLGVREAFFTIPPEPTVYYHPDVSSVCDCNLRTAAPERLAGSADTEFLIQPSIEDQWNHEKINMAGGYASKFSGKGIRIAILDTGIASHTDLEVKGGISFCEGVADFRSDPFGHGTHCAGIVAGRLGGIAKEADLFSIKVTDTTGATPVAILAGMCWALRNRMDVVSISLAGAADLTLIPAFANAVQALMGINCLVVASTGDSGSDVGFPANTPGIIAVGGCDSELVILKNTCIGGNGNHLTVVAPGKDIKTTFHTGNDYVRAFTGSSAAAPHVAGLIALIKEKLPDIPALQVVGRILVSAQPMYTPSGEPEVLGGTTLVDCDKALAL